MTRKGKASTKDNIVVSGKGRAPHGTQGGTLEANRLAISILEVLAGVRTPTDAAAALAVSVPRYYQLEMRALEGLVAACEPRAKGKQPSLEKRVAELERELERAERACARQQALVRAAHRSLGLKAPAVVDKKKPLGAGGRRQRRPTVRALKAIDALRKKVGTPDGEPLQQAVVEGNGLKTAQSAGGPAA